MLKEAILAAPSLKNCARARFGKNIFFHFAEFDFTRNESHNISLNKDLGSPTETKSKRENCVLSNENRFELMNCSYEAVTD